MPFPPTTCTLAYYFIPEVDTGHIECHICLLTYKILMFHLTVMRLQLRAESTCEILS